MPIHPNSLAAHHSNRYDARSREILAAYHRLGIPLTDRQIMENLGFVDPNKVRPRIQKLLELGALVEMAPMRCPVTGKTVRRCMPTGYTPEVARTSNDALDLFANQPTPRYE